MSALLASVGSRVRWSLIHRGIYIMNGKRVLTPQAASSMSARRALQSHLLNALLLELLGTLLPHLEVFFFLFLLPLFLYFRQIFVIFCCKRLHLFFGDLNARPLSQPIHQLSRHLLA